VIYRVLGELVIGPDTSPVRLPTGHTLDVLVGLLLNANRQVSVSELVDVTWGRSEINTATEQLYKAVSGVRGLLRGIGRAGDLISRRGNGYELRVPDEELDSLSFAKLVRQAEDAKAKRRPDDEIELRWRALSLWRGPHPVSNVARHGWPHAAGELDRRRRRAAIRLFDLEIGRRNYDAILDQLAELSQGHPTDARLHEQLMIALYRGGFAVEAVAVFERYEDALSRAGVRPDRAMRDLGYAISVDDDESIARAERAIADRGTDHNAVSAPTPRTAALTPGTASESTKDDGLEACRQTYTVLLTLTRQAHRGLVGGDFGVVHAPIPDAAVPAEARAQVEASARDWFEAQRSTIRATVDHCAELGLSGLAWDLAFSTHEFYTRGAHFEDWLATHQAALRACRAAGDRRGEAIMLVGLGQPALMASRRAGGLSTPEDLKRATEVLADAGDAHGLAIAERTLGDALRRDGQLVRPLDLFERALGHYQAAGDVVGVWQTLRDIGHTYLDRRHPYHALRWLDRALGAAAALPGDQATAQTRYWMGHAHLALGDTEAACVDFAAVEAYERSGDTSAAAVTARLSDRYRVMDLPSGDGTAAAA
jgi:DNA-binding SARP family transcriptional activator